MQHQKTTAPLKEVLENSHMADKPRCPRDCDGTMQVNTLASPAPFIGLEPVCCTHCDHQGMVSRLGIQLLFRGGREYLFSYGNTVTTLTVVLTAQAIEVFKSHRLTPDVLAKQVAEWALLKGQCTGTVRLSLASATMDEFYRHYCRGAVHPSQGSVGKTHNL